MKTHKVTEVVGGVTMTFDNRDEWYFALWLDDICREFSGHLFHSLAWGYKLYTFKLFDKVDVIHKEQGKRKIIEKTQCLLQDATYTPDFSFYIIRPELKGFVDLAKETLIKNALFIRCGGSFHIDVKPSFSRNNAEAAKFSIIQKALWDKHGEYVNKVVPETLFKQTFTPQRYLLTDKDMKPRKIGWKIKTVHEWIKEATDGLN